VKGEYHVIIGVDGPDPLVERFLEEFQKLMTNKQVKHVHLTKQIDIGEDGGRLETGYKVPNINQRWKK